MRFNNPSFLPLSGSRVGNFLLPLRLLKALVNWFQPVRVGDPVGVCEGIRSASQSGRSTRSSCWIIISSCFRHINSILEGRRETDVKKRKVIKNEGEIVGRERERRRRIHWSRQFTILFYFFHFFPPIQSSCLAIFMYNNYRRVMSRKVFAHRNIFRSLENQYFLKPVLALAGETFVRMIAPGHYEWPCTPSCCCCCRRCYCCRRGCQWGRKSTAVANEERRAPDICVCPRRLLTAAAAGRILERTARERGGCLSLRRSGRYCRGGGEKKKKKIIAKYECRPRWGSLRENCSQSHFYPSCCPVH